MLLGAATWSEVPAGGPGCRAGVDGGGDLFRWDHLIAVLGRPARPTRRRSWPAWRANHVCVLHTR